MTFSAAISEANLDLLRAYWVTSASILDLLSAFSVKIYAYTLDLLKATSVATLDAAMSAANLDLLSAD